MSQPPQLSSFMRLAAELQLMIAEKLPLGAYMSLLQISRRTYELLASAVPRRAALEFLYPSPGGRSVGSYIYRLSSVRNIELLENILLICDRIAPSDASLFWDRCHEWQLKPWYEAEFCTCSPIGTGRADPAACTCYYEVMGIDLDGVVRMEGKL